MHHRSGHLSSPRVGHRPMMTFQRKIRVLTEDETAELELPGWRRPLRFEVCGVRGSEPRLAVDRNPQEPRFAKPQTSQDAPADEAPLGSTSGRPSWPTRGSEIGAVTLQCQVLLVAAFVGRAASQHDSVKYCEAKNSRNKAGMSMKTNDEYKISLRRRAVQTRAGAEPSSALRDISSRFRRRSAGSRKSQTRGCRKLSRRGGCPFRMPAPALRLVLSGFITARVCTALRLLGLGKTALRRTQNSVKLVSRKARKRPQKR